MAICRRRFVINYALGVVDSAPSIFVPHSLQNFVPGAIAAWQFGHLACSCFAPHSLQNFAPA
jgi:hypothetical protein